MAAFSPGVHRAAVDAQGSTGHGQWEVRRALFEHRDHGSLPLFMRSSIDNAFFWSDRQSSAVESLC